MSTSAQFSKRFKSLKQLLVDEDNLRVYGESVSRRYSPLTSPESSDSSSDRCPQHCSFRDTGESFTHQPWYYCVTCYGSASDSGVCYGCAVTCHQGHVLVYSRSSRFYCDCGAKGNCKCLKADQVGKRKIKSLVSWANNLTRCDGIRTDEDRVEENNPKEKIEI